MATEQVSIFDGEKVVELSAQDSKVFLDDRALMLAESNAIKAEQDARAAARESALAKLADLGLTAEEIAAL